MSRRYHTVEVEVDVCLDDFDTSELIEELRSRGGFEGSVQSPMDAKLLDDLARTLELGRPMDATERRLTALRLREMIDPEHKVSERIAEAYRKWQAEHRAAH